jgi:hypothetical protein
LPLATTCYDHTTTYDYRRYYSPLCSKDTGTDISMYLSVYIQHIDDHLSGSLIPVSNMYRYTLYYQYLVRNRTGYILIHNTSIPCGDNFAENKNLRVWRYSNDKDKTSWRLSVDPDIIIHVVHARHFHQRDDCQWDWIACTSSLIFLKSSNLSIPIYVPFEQRLHAPYGLRMTYCYQAWKVHLYEHG